MKSVWKDDALEDALERPSFLFAKCLNLKVSEEREE